MRLYGVFNNVKMQYQFGICEPTKQKAWKKLLEKIGKDAYRWRFEIRKLPKKGR